MCKAICGLALFLIVILSAVPALAAGTTCEVINSDELGVKAYDPLGEYLVWEKLGEGYNYLCIALADGQQDAPSLIETLASPVFVSEIVWSHSGESFAYIVDSGEDPNIVTNSHAFIYELGQGNGTGRIITVDSVLSIISGPVWSDDDTYVAFWGDLRGYDYSWVFVYNPSYSFTVGFNQYFAINLEWRDQRSLVVSLKNKKTEAYLEETIILPEQKPDVIPNA